MHEWRTSMGERKMMGECCVKHTQKQEQSERAAHMLNLSPIRGEFLSRGGQTRRLLYILGHSALLY